MCLEPSKDQDQQQQKLLRFDELPPFLRFNSFIKTGYYSGGPTSTSQTPTDTRNLNVHDKCRRHCSSFLRTIFCWHNETINIWMHLLMSLFFLCCAVYEVQLLLRDHGNHNDDKDDNAHRQHLRQPFRFRICTFASAMGNMIVGIGSVYYHSTMHACRNRAEYTVCLNCDLLSIFFSVFTVGTMKILYGYKCHGGDTVDGNMNVLSYGLMSAFICITYCSVRNSLSHNACSKVRAKNVGTFILFQTLFVLVVLSLSGVYHQCWTPVYFECLSFCAIIIGGIINALRIPERFFIYPWFNTTCNQLSAALVFIISPAVFGVGRIYNRNLSENQRCGRGDTDDEHRWIDFVGNSHQLWHMFGFAGALFCYMAGVYTDHLLNNEQYVDCARGGFSSQLQNTHPNNNTSTYFADNNHEDMKVLFPFAILEQFFSIPVCG